MKCLRTCGNLWKAAAVTAAAAAISGVMAVSALAAGGLDLSTRYTGISAKPGDTLSFELNFENTTGSGLNTALTASGLPDGWSGYFEGSGKTVSSVYVRPTSSVQGADPNSGLVSYNVTIPDEAKKGDYDITLKAAAGAAQDAGDAGPESVLSVKVSVTDEAAGNNVLETTYPEQQGAGGQSFTFNSTIRNNSSGEQTYSLAAEAPAGWKVAFKPSGQSMEVSSIGVSGHGTQGMTITVTPPEAVEAGTYVIPVTAVSSAQDLASELKVTITGTYDLDVLTADGRLSFDASVGKTQAVTLNVVNKGNIGLNGVNLTSQAPGGWTVDFSESSIDVLPAGQTKEITMNVTPGKDAMSGDYAMTLKAQNADTSVSQSFRVTVRTSTRWGVIGVCLIGLMLLGLSEVFRRFGRH